MATVITKDLSRLGRNYLKTGELIEIVFPENGVRYIAINDGVDTAREDNEFTPLRNWFNEFYARDTSKKIRAVKQAQAQKGERVNGEYPVVLHLITKIQLLKIRSNKLLHHGKSIKLGALDNITREKFSKTSGNSLKYISYQ